MLKSEEGGFAQNKNIYVNYFQCIKFIFFILFLLIWIHINNYK